MRYQCPKCGDWTIASKKDVQQYGVPLCNNTRSHRRPVDMQPMTKEEQKRIADRLAASNKG